MTFKTVIETYNPKIGSYRIFNINTKELPPGHIGMLMGDCLKAAIEEIGNSNDWSIINKYLIDFDTYYALRDDGTNQKVQIIDVVKRLCLIEFKERSIYVPISDEQTDEHRLFWVDASHLE